MKALIQRVSEAEVKIRGHIVTAIKKGVLIFLCVVKGDTEKDLEYIFKKAINLRIFDDAEGKMNRSIQDIKGEILVVSQFTLVAEIRKGNRPSFDEAETSEKAKRMYNIFIQRLIDTGLKVQTGVFGEYMQVSLINDGPVTILINSRDECKR